MVGEVTARTYENSSSSSIETGVKTVESSSEQGSDICVNEGEIDIAPASEEDARHFESLALRSSDLRQFRRALRTTYGRQFQLQLADRYTLAVGEEVAVYIPIRGGTGDSFYGIWFNRNSEEVTKTVSGLFAFDSDENVTLEFQFNGETRLDATLTQNGQVVSGVAYDEEGNEINLNDLVIVSGFWSCMTDCLSQAGVPLYLITGLSIICAAACVVTAGFACGACIAAALGAWSGVGAACLAFCT
jgi:hypothetical protein